MASFDQHLEAHVPEVLALARSGRTRPDLVAILLTESYFRSRLDRALEYVAWAILWVLRSERLRFLSVGPGQIQLRHWIGIGAIAGLTPKVSHILVTTSWAASYDLAGLLVPAGSGWKRVAALYRGEARSYHVALLGRAAEWFVANPVSRHRINTQSQHAPRAGRGPSEHAVHSGRRFPLPLAGTARLRL